jgi:N-acetylglucosamine-6-phosphate deacetylase
MTTLVISGGQVLSPRESRFTNVWIEGDQIETLSDQLPDKGSRVQEIDARGCFVTPGLFDLQVNGGPQCDLWACPDIQDLQKLRAYLASQGVTSFLPTLITCELAHLGKNMDFLQKQGAGACQTSAGQARMPGIHLEGPCLSPHKPGVHPPEHLQPLSVELMQQLARDAVKLMTIAPELEPTGMSLKYLQDHDITVALGHSNADFAEAQTAFAGGIRLMTHTFNALPALHHRALGAVGAALLDKQVTCCVIADGLHVDPQAIALIVRLKGVDKTVLVSDAAYTGTSQGGLVGSSITLNEAVINMVKWGIVDFREAVLMASYNAARAVGLEQKIGNLIAGAAADAVLWDSNTLQIKGVILGGQLVKN